MSKSRDTNKEHKNWKNKNKRNNKTSAGRLFHLIFCKSHWWCPHEQFVGRIEKQQTTNTLNTNIYAKKKKLSDFISVFCMKRNNRRSFYVYYRHTFNMEFSWKVLLLPSSERIESRARAFARCRFKHASCDGHDLAVKCTFDLHGQSFAGRTLNWVR